MPQAACNDSLDATLPHFLAISPVPTIRITFAPIAKQGAAATNIVLAQNLVFVLNPSTHASASSAKIEREPLQACFTSRT